MQIVTVPIQKYLQTSIDQWFSNSEQNHLDKLPKSQALQWVSSRIALKQAYILHTDTTTNSHDIKVSTLPTGQPYLFSQPNLHISLSHTVSDTIAAVADHPIGVDIEILKPRAPSLLAHICNASEQQLLTHQSPQQQLYNIWLLKEALLKAIGLGLTASMTDIQITKHQDDIYQLTTTLHEITHWQGCILPINSEIVASTVIPYSSNIHPTLHHFQPS